MLVDLRRVDLQSLIKELWIEGPELERLARAAGVEIVKETDEMIIRKYIAKDDIAKIKRQIEIENTEGNDATI